MYKNQDIIEKFASWFKEAETKYLEKNLENFNSFVLSTAINNKPSSRVLLLKEYSSEGFIFYSNNQSRKAKEFNENNNVAMNFYWNILQKQIRIEGIIEQLDNEKAEKYFAGRPYLSKIGAWASKQSAEIDSFAKLEEEVDFYKDKYKKDVPKPPYWLGFIIKPSYIEFWSEKQFRLHLREVYKKQDDEFWDKKTLYP